MRKIIFPIAIIALFLASCSNGETVNTEEKTATDSIVNTDENIEEEDILLVSRIDLTNNEGVKNGVTLKYDNDNRLIKMIPKDGEVPTKISYDGNTISVETEFITTKYEINGNEITETASMDGEILIKTIHKIKDGQIQESKRVQSSVDMTTTYKWKDNCLMETVETINDMGDENVLTTEYKYSNARNIFNIDMINILNNYLFDEPGVGSLIDGFQSEFLPEEIIWEGVVDGYIPTKNIFKYEYVYDEELISEIHIFLTHITTEDEDNEEVEKTSSTVKITY